MNEKHAYSMMLPLDVHEWIVRRANKNMRSKSKELLRIIYAEMARDAENASED